MGVALQIVPKQQIEGFDHSVGGEALGRASQADLDDICRSIGVKPLTRFFGRASEDWFDPSEGLETVDMLLHHLGREPSAIEDAKNIVKDLEEYRDVLQRLEQEGVDWHLAREA